jgi:hypothetical protein
MQDDLNPYRWQDHVITPQLSAANLVASALIMIVIGGAAVFAGPDPTGTALPSAGAPVARATEREPCLALIARPSMLVHRAGRHML